MGGNWLVRFGGAGPGGSYIFIRVIKAANGARARARRQRLSGMTAASTIFLMIQQLLVYASFGASHPEACWRRRRFCGARDNINKKGGIRGGKHGIRAKVREKGAEKGRFAAKENERGGWRGV